ncbi:hypothetical protein MATL_G00092680 [Megalops atlanticus]|uniref:Uncharacterized protein n=1 Tax=Megalops atlanticus TaxID=7932 RepID=A0A9D3Q9A6_MEGAT|nr:hypothetical protein MATL_G00092680 [Megalops atlanticus]
MSLVQLMLALWAVSMAPKLGFAFELQDTIHALIEENIHLHDQLENLTQALRELKQLLWNHSRDKGGEHDPDLQHLWEEWTQHGISAETHLLLEHAFCGHDLHGAASTIQTPFLMLLTIFTCLGLLLF